MGFTLANPLRGDQDLGGGRNGDLQRASFLQVTEAGLGPKPGPQGKHPACWELSFVVLRLKGQSGGPPVPSHSSVHGDHAVLPESELTGSC